MAACRRLRPATATERRAAPVLLRLVRSLPPEVAHRLGLLGLRLWPARPPLRRARLHARLGQFELPHPLGLAAGLDKNAEAVDALLALGFAFVEVGTVTPRPQPGNPRPRLFRLIEDRALINRMGFNNEGMDRVAVRLARRRRDRGVVGVNIGINRDSADPVADYRLIYDRLAPLADYVTINVSSPNTPGLRDLQAAARLQPILHAVRERRHELGLPSPVFVKLAPDLETDAIGEIVELAVASGIDGLVVSNTTVARPPGLRSPLANQAGGLSGRPLFALATSALRTAARHAAGRLWLIGVGGIWDGADAYAKIRAGAHALQLYTAFVYRGPRVLNEILYELDMLLERDGFASLEEAVGADLRADRPGD